MPIAIISGSSLPITACRKVWLELFGIAPWPAEGIASDRAEAVQLGGTASPVFWIAEEFCRDQIAVRLAPSVVLRFPDAHSWCWYLGRAFPDSPSFVIPRGTIAPGSTTCTMAFSLSFLRVVFHDIKSVRTAFVARTAARWLAGWKEPWLHPFAELERSDWWDSWKNRAEAIAFWSQLCFAYQEVANLTSYVDGPAESVLVRTLNSASLASDRGRRAFLQLLRNIAREVRTAFACQPS